MSLSSTLSWGRTFDKDKVDNQTFGDTLQKLSQLLMEKSQSGSNRMLITQGWSLRVFLTECNSWRQLGYSYGLGKKRWNLEAASAVVEFMPP